MPNSDDQTARALHDIALDTAKDTFPLRRSVNALVATVILLTCVGLYLANLDKLHYLPGFLSFLHWFAAPYGLLALTAFLMSNHVGRLTLIVGVVALSFYNMWHPRVLFPGAPEGAIDAAIVWTGEIAFSIFSCLIALMFSCVIKHDPVKV